MIDVLRLFADFRVESNPRANPGWLNVRCPFCGDTGQHLGVREDGEYANCWRCGGHDLEYTLRGILRLSRTEVQKVLAQYSVESVVRAGLNRRQPRARALELPGGPLNPRERRYLTARGFDPDLLAEKYQIQGGGIVGEWAWRIVIPLIIGGRVVSWTARDITGKSDLRYKTLAIENSVVDPKTTVFNLDHSRRERGVLVEGPFDALKGGDGFVCSFGTSMTPAQLRLLSQRFESLVILFDPSPAAQARAWHYAQLLAVIGRTEIEIVDTEIDRDPGDMTGEEIRDLRRVLGLEHIYT